MTCRRAPPAAAAPLLALLLVAAVAAPAAARGAPEAALAHPRSLLQSTCCDGVTVSASAGAAATCVGSAITFSVPAAAGSAGGATLNIAPIGTGSVAVATAGLSTSTCNPAKSAAWGWAAANNQLSLSTPDTNVEPGCTNATCSADAAKEGTRDTTIAIAGAHSCTIRDNDGSVWCSGENEDGQLGNGATTDQKVPVQVTLSASVPLTGVKSIAAGSKDEDDGHTCACTAEGAAFCWGRRESGQLGVGGGNANTLFSRPTPVLVGNTNTPLADCASVATSETHTCFATNGGQLYCTGKNDRYQLGLGTDTTTRFTAQLVPAASFDSSSVVSVATGKEFTCVVLANGKARCVGYNKEAQLGRGTTDNGGLPNWADVTGITDAVAVAVGTEHACVLRTGGRVSCWGKGAAVGDGNEGLNKDPVQVTLPSGTGAIQVSAGFEHTCALLSSGGSVYCWGEGGKGQLGTGDDDKEMQPTLAPVLSGLAPLTLAAGGFSTCVIDAAGARYCVGSNKDGQLGDDKKTDKVETPAVKTFGTNVWRATTPAPAILVTGGQAACSLSLILAVTTEGACTPACSAAKPTITAVLSTPPPIFAGPQNTALVSISVTAVDDSPSGTTFTCTNATGAQVASGPAGTTTFSTNLPEGDSTITCIATDCLGQTSDPATLTVTVIAVDPGPSPCVDNCVNCDVSGEQGKCDICDAGFYLQPEGTCADTCPTGTEPNADATACTGCAPGYGGPTCDKCLVGFWSPGSNGTGIKPDCTSCSSAFTTATDGSTNQDACTLCRPGRCGQLCGRCRAGSYAPEATVDTPRPACVVCPIPFTSVVQGASFPDCKACRPGYGGGSCDPCGHGKWSSGGTFNDNRPECRDCPVGTWHTFSTAASALSCRSTGTGRRMLK